MIACPGRSLPRPVVLRVLRRSMSIRAKLLSPRVGIMMNLVVAVSLLLILPPPQTSASDSHYATPLQTADSVGGIGSDYINADSWPSVQAPVSVPYQVVSTPPRRDAPNQVDVSQHGPEYELQNRQTIAVNYHLGDTNDNRVYQNSTYGYSVNLLPGWTVWEYAPSYLRLVQDSYKIGDPIPETYLSILVMNNSTHLPLEDWIQIYAHFPSKPSFVNIDGVESAQWMNTNTVKKANSFSYIPNGEIVYQMSLVTMEESNETVEAELIAMQSSFKITKVISEEVRTTSESPTKSLPELSPFSSTLLVPLNRLLSPIPFK